MSEDTAVLEFETTIARKPDAEGCELQSGGAESGDPVGSRLLEEGRSLLPVLSDLRSLWALPEGSLGREYARFMEAEELSVTDFAEASLASMNESDYDDRRAWILAQRLRDMHDLIHVVSGYGRDLLGEMAVLSFSSGAPKARENYRLFFILRLARWQFGRSGRPDAASVLRAAEERGARAAFLPAVEWERLLPGSSVGSVRTARYLPTPCVRTDPL